jgi:hypothetical protein
MIVDFRADDEGDGVLLSLKQVLAAPVVQLIDLLLSKSRNKEKKFGPATGAGADGICAINTGA